MSRKPVFRLWHWITLLVVLVVMTVIATDSFRVSDVWATPVADPGPGPDKKSTSELAGFANEFGMRFVLISPGTFMMGSNDGAKNEKPSHPVQISKSFYLQITEMNQEEWQTVMGSSPWQGKSEVKEGPEYPASNVSWDDAQRLIQRMNESSQWIYRLPTEAEWEYACRGGTKTRYSFGDDPEKLEDYGWYGDNTVKVGKAYSQPVGLKKPNDFGLYDMHGNVWEWCADYYGEAYYSFSPGKDPKGPDKGYSRVLRGGSFQMDAQYCRSAMRVKFFQDNRYPYFGIRLVAEPR